ncbi:MAG: hypothetical protein IT546_00805 [Caulobacteraceae bacterium]|nr:hypothetical protein [Caulobacteraceae bacterium]
MLKIITLTLAAASLAGAATAADRVTDVEYLKAARCAGLMKSAHLGEPDGAAVEAFLKAQRRGRAPAVLDMADKRKQDARAEAARAGGDKKAHLQAEREGACRNYAA